MFCCKKNLFVQFVMCSCLFYILTTSKRGVVAFEIKQLCHISRYLNNIWHFYLNMSREYKRKVSSKNSNRLLKNLQNTTGGYFFAAPCIMQECVKTVQSTRSSKVIDFSTSEKRACDFLQYICLRLWRLRVVQGCSPKTGRRLEVSGQWLQCT